MKYKNSFFKIDTDNNGTYLILYPPVSDGKNIEFEEIKTYIDDNLKIDYSLDAVKKIFSSLKDKVVKGKISEQKADDLAEKAKITISKDRMVAYIRFYPPIGNGKRMSKREILAEASMEKIKYGVADKAIDVFLAMPQYCLDIPIAKGKKVVAATDTKIEYMFNIKPLAKPRLLEDGSVDFHELDIFTPVHEGDILAVMTPHNMGEAGVDVFGNKIPQNKPKIKRLKFGRNIKISEDGNTIYSIVNGNVTFSQDTVFVSDTYTVAADVDASTGDINYDGNVMVNGNVRTGFSIKAQGNVQVNGVVEGANIDAGGNIIIKRGVQGMGKGTLKAGGDICARFFESTNVFALGDVNAGSILHSQVKSGGKTIVSGKKGFIVGGEIICNGSVEVNSIGNKMETQTVVKVGVKPELYDEMKVLISSVNSMNNDIEETSSYLNVYKEKLKKGIALSPENIKQIKVYNTKLEELKMSRNKKMDRLKDVRKELDEGKKGFVKVYGSSYRGVSISIASQTYSVVDKDNASCYRLVDGEIVKGMA